ncbi:MAG: hypothetical protein QN163_00415 [Armatimonadota bacterium]|nr:hypothetical protein [Armatimonadota bacterium]MDR5696601.1 hypothetical protein [Armatimonadota bacterium]
MTPVSWRSLLALYVPLMLSGLLMTLEAPLIVAGIARQPAAELFLAAFGVAFAIALIYEAPVIMVLEASIALTDGWAAYLRLRRAYLLLGGALTALGIAVFFTPVYDLLTAHLMGIPEPIARAARPALMILTFWPLPIGWRRLHQGVLIRYERAGIISVATGIRLLILAAVLFSGVFRTADGAVLGALAMVVGVTVEAVVVTIPALTLLGPRPGATGQRPWRALWSYYWPLAGTTLLQQTSRPLITTGVAAARDGALSLAAWPVVLSISMFSWGPLNALQQVIIAVADHEANRRRVLRFVLAIGGGLTATLVLVTHTALLDVLFRQAFGISSALAALATPAARLLSVIPLVMALQSYFRGRLIRDGRTRVVQRAMLANLAVVAGAVAGALTFGPLSGAVFGALAILSGGVAEMGALWWGGRTAAAPAPTPEMVEVSRPL